MPATRVDSVQEYYFSKKLKEVAAMNAAGMRVISLGVGSPDLPPSDGSRSMPPGRTRLPALYRHSRTAAQLCRMVSAMVRRGGRSGNGNPAAYRLERRDSAYLYGFPQSG